MATMAPGVQRANGARRSAESKQAPPRPLPVFGVLVHGTDPTGQKKKAPKSEEDSVELCVGVTWPLELPSILYADCTVFAPG